MKLQAPDGSVVILDSREIKELVIPPVKSGAGAPSYCMIWTAGNRRYLVQWMYAQEIENQMVADNQSPPPVPTPIPLPPAPATVK
jgi:hypothetical protein